MLNKRTSSFQIWVYVAYGYYFLIGLAWFLMSLLKGGRFNIYPVFIMAIFGVQYYYKHLITNLVLGLLSLLLSIYSLLEAVNLAAYNAKLRPLEMADRLLITLPVIGLVMSGILVFSYIKLNLDRKL